MQLISKHSYLFGVYSREKYATKRSITKNDQFFYGFGDLNYSYNGSTDPLYLFLNNPALSLVVGRLAEYISDLTFYIDIEGEEDYTNEVTKLLRKPNESQSQKDFIQNWAILLLLYGYVPIFDERKFESVDARVENTKGLHVINPKLLKSYKRSLIDILLSRKKDVAFQYKETKDGIQHTRDFYDHELIKFYDGASGLEGDSQKGISRIKALINVCDNIKKSLEGENVVLGNPGGFGIISNSSKDAAGSIPLSAEEKQSIENRISNNGVYGNQLGQKQWIVTSQDLDVHQFNSRLKDYTYNDNYFKNLIKVASAFGFPKELLGFDDAKYENKKVAEVQLYTNICQSYADSMCESLTNFFELDHPLRATYKFIPSVAEAQFESKKKQTEHISDAADMCVKLYSMGVDVSEIEEQYQELTGFKITINEQFIKERSGETSQQD